MILLPPLPYAYDALQPLISERTLRLHHDRHHAKYVETVNEIARDTLRSDLSLESLIRNARLDAEQRLLDNSGQAWNHQFFWRSMSPDIGAPQSVLHSAIDTSFGGLDNLRSEFLAVGGRHFGSGWVWLVANGDRLTIATTHDGESFAESGSVPLLTCDLWEHAYYLDHQNDRGAYLAGWWDGHANWAFAEAQFASARGDGVAWVYPADGSPERLADPHVFDRALDQVAGYLRSPPPLGSAEDRTFTGLLDQLAGHAEAIGPAHPDQKRLLDLSLRLDIARQRQAEPVRHPWSPALGMDLRPEGLRRGSSG
jgi:Fe-Mn family superoxide dismutase